MGEGAFGTTTIIMDRGLCFQEPMPLVWSPRPQGVGDMERLQLADESLRVLALLATLEERVSVKGDDNNAVARELRRIEAKLDLLMLLVGAASNRDRALPEPSVVTMFPDRLEWRLGWNEAVEPGPGVLELYAHRASPAALRLPALAAVPVKREDGRWAAAAFEGLEEPLEEALNRLVFRRHRRGLAGLRRAAHQGD